MLSKRINYALSKFEIRMILILRYGVAKLMLRELVFLLVYAKSLQEPRRLRLFAPDTDDKTLYGLSKFS